MNTIKPDFKEQMTGEGGLAVVVACSSKICFIDGEKGRLLYRGYDVVDLAEFSTFEEVAYLLWFGRLPGLTEFQAFLDGFTGSFVRVPNTSGLWHLIMLILAQGRPELPSRSVV